MLGVGVGAAFANGAGTLGEVGWVAVHVVVGRKVGLNGLVCVQGLEAGLFGRYEVGSPWILYLESVKIDGFVPMSCARQWWIKHNCKHARRHMFNVFIKRRYQSR